MPRNVNSHQLWTSVPAAGSDPTSEVLLKVVLDMTCSHNVVSIWCRGILFRTRAMMCALTTVNKSVPRQFFTVRSGWDGLFAESLEHEISDVPGAQLFQ